MKVAESIDGTVRFFIDLRVSADEMKDWPADRITAFFEGLAKAVAAKEGRAPEPLMLPAAPVVDLMTGHENN